MLKHIETNMKIAFHTLGCKVNQYETEAMAQLFREHGHVVVEENEFADVYVINTCTVTAVADKKSRQYIRRMKKVNPDSIVAVTGCYSQIAPDDVAAVKGVDIVTGTNEKASLIEMVEDFAISRQTDSQANDQQTDSQTSNQQADGQLRMVHPYEELGEFVEMGTVASTENRTRAYIKIQEGCNRFCSYCVIPFARGPVRSRALEDIVAEARALIDAGYKELVLTGINTAQYDMEGRNLYAEASPTSEECAEASPTSEKCAKASPTDEECTKTQATSEGDDEIFGVEKAIAAINDLPGEFRIRLSSLEPAVVNSNYVKRLFKYDKLCHHLHMSAQSGSDRILKAMNRPYDSDGYYDLVNTLFEFDDCYGVSTDIIVGFPGEKDADFEESCDLVKECSFCKTHIFKYSKRPLTKAAEMKNQVSPQIKQKRAERLAEVAAASAHVFYEINLAAAVEDGRTETVLIEEIVSFSDETGNPQHYYTGYTGNYIRTYIPADKVNAEDKLNTFARVKLVDLFRDGMRGEIV